MSQSDYHVGPQRAVIYKVTPHEEVAIREGLAELERGEWTSEESMRAFFGRAAAFYERNRPQNI
jgi:mRNA-degrading endonuclease HigB of HigAB toxin-antitoxin module